MKLSGKIIQLNIIDTTASACRRRSRHKLGPATIVAAVLITIALLVFVRGIVA